MSLVRNIALVLFFLIGVPISGAQTKSSMAEMKETIAFLFVRNGTNYQAIGTGFWLGVPIPGKTNEFRPFLATAKHVLTLDGRVGSADFVTNLYVRVNTRSGKSKYYHYPKDVGDNVLLHPDRSVDVALLATGTADPEAEIRNFNVVHFEKRELCRCKR